MKQRRKKKWEKEKDKIKTNKKCIFPGRQTAETENEKSTKQETEKPLLSPYLFCFGLFQ